MGRATLRGEGRYLAPGEEIRYITRQHVIVLVKPFFIWLLTLAAITSFSFVLTQGSPIPFLDTVGLIVGVLVSLYAGLMALEWWKDRYVITNQRVLLIEGTIAIKVSAVSLARINETSFARSLWGRVLRYGELKLDSPGEQLGLATLSYLPKPEAVYRLITSLLFQNRDGGGDRRGAVDPSEANTGPLPPIVL